MITVITKRENFDWDACACAFLCKLESKCNEGLDGKFLGGEKFSFFFLVLEKC